MTEPTSNAAVTDDAVATTAVDVPEPALEVASDTAPESLPADVDASTGDETVETGDETAETGDETADETAEADPDEAGAEASETAAEPKKGSVEVLESEAEIAADYLEELLDIADLDGDIDTYIEGDRAHVSIVSESDLLVGNNGAVLDALQELARLAVMTETGDRSRLMLDVAGFRDRRRTELIKLAAEAVAEVKSNSERVPLSPMNPFERKIVHDAVAAAGLISASEGEEPKRHVVVLPVG